MATQDDFRRVLALHRNDPSVSLDCCLPLYYQMDTDFCEATSAELSTYGTAWEVHRATKDLWRQLPKESGVYLFVLEPSLNLRLTNGMARPATTVIYVGRAGAADAPATLKDRYRGEYSRLVGGDPNVLWEEGFARTRVERLKKYLTVKPLNYWYSIIEDLSKIRQVEANLIKIFNPPLNVAGRARVKLEKPKPAFGS